MTDREKLDAVITSLIDTLHTNTQQTDGNIPLNNLTALASSIDHLTAARARIPPSRAEKPITLEGRSNKPPMFPARR